MVETKKDGTKNMWETLRGCSSDNKKLFSPSETNSSDGLDNMEKRNATQTDFHLLPKVLDDDEDSSFMIGNKTLENEREAVQGGRVDKARVH